MKSIRARLLLAVLGMLAAAALLVGAVTYRRVHADTEALFDLQLRQVAMSLRDVGEVAPAQASALVDEQLDFVVQVWSADGRAIHATRAHRALPQRAQLGFADVPVQGMVWRTFSVATPSRVIQVAQPLAVRRRLAAEAAFGAVQPLLWLAPFMAVAAWWITALALKPLERLADGLKRRDAQSLAALPEAGLPDELAPLAAALNALLDRLRQSLDTQRAFVADAAHELRSPLTALKLQLRLLERASDNGARRHAIDALASGIERAARLVEQLLTLARSEPGAAAAAAERLDLGELVRAALADIVPLAAARGTTLELRAASGLVVDGDRAGLSALVRNLADNAVRYAPRGARVELALAREDDAAVLHVDDSGPGIPESERGQVFDRFVRRAPSTPGAQQDADDAAGGSGLGLAIVRSVAARHGATVSLGDSPLGGLRVIVRLRAPAA